MKKIELLLLVGTVASVVLAGEESSKAAFGGIEPIVPIVFDSDDADQMAANILQIRRTTGLRRFFACGPGFNKVMYKPFPDDLYRQLGRDIAKVKQALVGTDVEIGWWCSPSIRYFSDLPSIEDFEGHRSADNKKCPYDPAFAADFAGKVRAVAEECRPSIINIEDDYTLSWGRGLNGWACFCPRHLADFAKRYGKPLTGPEIVEAYRNRTPANRAIRQAFSDAVRESLVSLAKKVRAAVDEVDPSIRIMLCECAGGDTDGDSTEPVVRAFAGPNTRPIVRPQGSIYGAETTPAVIPDAIAHAVYTIEHLPKDVETYYESDPYPHNRFYTSAAQLTSMMAGATMAGTENYLFYCLQYLDDPLEDRGYVDAFFALKPRFESVRDFIRTREARLAGVRTVYFPADKYLIRGGFGHGEGPLKSETYLLSKFGIPYTTRTEAKGPAILAGGMAETMSDDEIRTLLSGGVLLDAQAAEMLVQRGFGKYLGTEVEMSPDRLPIVDEAILPAADYCRPGRHVNAFYILFAGTEGTVKKFAKLRPFAGTEVWSEYRGVDKEVITPSLTLAKNELGGRVAVLSTSLTGNRSSGLYNLRKQELVRNLFRRLDPDGVPVAVIGVPGIWTMANVSKDGKSMLFMANNLSGDVRRDVRFSFSSEWLGATVFRLLEDGGKRPLGTVSSEWVAPVELGQMLPEFFIVEK